MGGRPQHAGATTWSHTAEWQWCTRALSHAWNEGVVRSCLMSWLPVAGTGSPCLWCHSLYWDICSKRYPDLKRVLHWLLLNPRPSPHSRSSWWTPTSVFKHLCVLPCLFIKLTGLWDPGDRDSPMWFSSFTCRVPGTAWMLSKQFLGGLIRVWNLRGKRFPGT